MNSVTAEKMSPIQNGVQLSKEHTTAIVASTSRPRFLIVGAGARGNAYARAVTESTNGTIAAVAEPIPSKREALGRKYIWRDESTRGGQSFEKWQDFVKYETHRRGRHQDGEEVPQGIDGVFICVLDELHAEVILGLKPLNLHIMCEKPLATTLSDCLKIYRSLQPSGTSSPDRIFSIGHVLRYSPHNMLLRKLLLSDSAIGEILSIEHTEPVGWWHFSHSYVRGNWRKESTTAPSLLTKSCHDIDFLLWLLCSAPPGSGSSSRHPPHLPSYVSSTGSLKYFKPSNKPALAGSATNCLSCPAERECIYSAQKIYQEQHLSKGNAGWPVHIVDPEIEDCLSQHGQDAASARLHERLEEDYDSSTPQEVIDSRPWFGRCVYESDNDVCDDQIVTITWDDDDDDDENPLASPTSPPNRSTRLRHRSAKTATFHMIAFTEAQCERRGRVYGTRGEITYDSRAIRVYDFASRSSKSYFPTQMGGGHGGGDDGLARQFVRAVEAVGGGREERRSVGGSAEERRSVGGGSDLERRKADDGSDEQSRTADGGNQTLSVAQAQSEYVGCSLEEVIRSHAMVFAAEEARRERKVVEWARWWRENVEAPMG